MCGICGEVCFGDSDRSRPERVRTMAAGLTHRGPDAEGMWSEGGVALGHRRLSIIDLSDAAGQPMKSPRGRYVLSYNGEVYNFREIKAELEGTGERFYSHSDSEVVLRSLACRGLGSLSRFHGMWAFALWDREEERLTLCRDGLGIKPLYWARIKDGLVFASEIPPILNHPEVSRRVHPRALAEQVACRYVLAPKTLFKSVQKLPPGHILTIDQGGIKVFPYWTLPIGERVGRWTQREAVEALGDLFEDSVRERLVADVPVGVLLSGGVDSSVVAAGVRRAGGEKLSTYTVAFQGAGKYDEREWAERVAKLLEADHHELVISPGVFADSLDSVLDHLDDPVADMAILPLYHVCALAGQHVKVLLSGEGADEILGGYHLDRVLRQIKTILRLRGLPGARRLGRMVAAIDPKRDYLRRWEDIRNAEAGQLPGKMRYDLTAPLAPERMNELVKGCTAPPYDRTLDAFYTEVPTGRGPLDAILSVLTRGWLPDNLLTHSDRMAMAHSVELRVPFLDRRLVELAFHLPERFKVSGGVTKVLLKKYAVKIGLPRSVAYRRKTGFPVPWSTWIRGPLKNKIRDVLEGASWFDPYFHRKAIRRVFDEHQEGKDLGLLLWNLTVLARWGEKLSVS